MSAMTGRLPDRHPLPRCSSIPATATASTRSDIWPAMPASFRPTLMAGSIAFTIRSEVQPRSLRRLAGAMDGGSSLSSPMSPSRYWQGTRGAARRRGRASDRRDLRDRERDQRIAGGAASRRAHNPHCAARRRARKLDAPRASPVVPPCRCRQGHGLHAVSGGPPFTRFLTDGRICLTNNAAERALRCVAMRRSLCPSSSSVWKHWKLVCRHDATRTTCSPNRGSHPFLLRVVDTDLVGSARHNLLGGKDAGLDEPADAVVRNSERRGGRLLLAGGDRYRDAPLGRSARPH